jgi:hypothetical protein
VDWKECVHYQDPIEALSSHLSGGVDKNHEKLQDGWCLGEIRTEHLLNSSLELYSYTQRNYVAIM